MTGPVFTSLHGGAALPQVILTLIEDARRSAARGSRVDLQIMCFAFTDRTLSTALIDLARDYPGVTIRILADWSQSSGGVSALRGMAGAGVPNLYIKFKLDAPYVWDAEARRLRYAYGASWGMLHHKTLGLQVDGAAHSLALGSYNWSQRGQQAYENTLVLTAAEHGATLQAFEAEFQALWSDHRLTAAPLRARHIFQRLRSEAERGGDLRDPRLLADAMGIAGPTADPAPPPRAMVGGASLVAFSGSRPAAVATGGGHARANDRRQINLLRPSGARRPAPLTLNTLALDAMRSIPDGAAIKLAMYALSSRVPEFATLIDAARRGCRVQVLLDGTIGAATAEGLTAFAARESLPIAVRTTRRRMHQKYLCCPDAALVLTGTANMTEDATTRHSDHRLLLREAPALASAFAADFDCIWARLGPSAA